MSSACERGNTLTRSVWPRSYDRGRYFSNRWKYGHRQSWFVCNAQSRGSDVSVNLSVLTASCSFDYRRVCAAFTRWTQHVFRCEPNKVGSNDNVQTSRKQGVRRSPRKEVLKHTETCKLVQAETIWKTFVNFRVLNTWKDCQIVVRVRLVAFFTESVVKVVRLSTRGEWQCHSAQTRHRLSILWSRSASFDVVNILSFVAFWEKKTCSESTSMLCVLLSIWYRLLSSC